MEHQAIAMLVRESASSPPRDPAACARVAARAAELGVPAAVADDLQQLWTPQGWVSSRAVHADVAPAVIWN